ncbi:insecticidal delta-endotoxin Cry8Ea1 family protein [Bacillus toyonensis]|uniref:insecticidal delta-endotoxin Cry8Ea1 family protein n=1 Tax=Bacillus toyonensis TaxID=155322 RepID=UPI000CD8C815|nr:insecticidal delta-endotoxin Cry8Ea1 family protein [Bacillus toyonensis]MED3539248.1 insecticidal delta-endotoxin Cry8Ea1 family protein [Bacillus toyonensis]MEE2021504.1 insecticidal delta-endotoxin Cry8Ea1 family protein [Bacillus toyonensis]
MNQNNQNEMHIIDSSSNDFSQSNRYPRYPLAKESNYKDWLASCDESNLDRLSTPSSVQDAVVTSLNIFSYIFGFLDAGATSAGLGILGVLFGQFWPSNNNAVWETFLRSVEELIAREIDIVERNRIMAQFDGLRNVMSNYNGALIDWDGNRDNTALQSEVRSRFDNADDAFALRIPEFRIKDFEIQSLAVYAQAATLHLLLLRDAVVNGQLWGVDPVTTQRRYEKLVCLSGAYADHCTFFYRQGLEELRGKGNWTAFNNYRRNMNIQVLDVISLFSNYDPRLYGNNTNTQLTREIFTEPLATPGWLDRYSNPDQFQQIEYNLNPSPSLSSTLLNLAADTGLGYYGAGAVTPRPIIQRTSMRRLNTGATVPFTTAWQGAPNPLISQQKQLSFEGFDVFNINSVVSREVSSQTSSLFGVQQAVFHTVIAGGNIPPTMKIIDLQPRGNYSTSVTSNIPGKRSATATASDYTHRLSSITSTSVGTAYRDRTNIMAYGWTHVSSEKTNRILPNRITQIPFVKGIITSSGTHVRSGPDHTGGSLVSMGGDAQFGMVVTSSARQRYRVRLRYAASNSVDFRLRISPLGVDYNFTLPGGGTSFNPDLRYSSFRYITLPIEFETPNSLLNFSFDLDTLTLMNGTCFFDRVEFLPVNSIALEYEGKQKLEKAKQAVDNLFTNIGKNALKVDTTDYDVDQAANLVECVPGELYTKEKMILLDEVKHAKQLSASRNLIQNGNFAFYTDEWTTSNNVSIQTDNQIFKGNYLKMPGARETEGGTTRFPTYVLQKIDESKLKPYTRYKVRGFVGSSHDVKLIVERYGKEVDAILNVRNDLALDTVSSSCVEVNQCQSQMYPIMHDGYLANVIDTNSYEEAQSDHANFKKEQGMCHQSHQFDFHIDTGEVHLNKNPGIWVLFKISSPEGHATLDNIELIEDGPLVGESLALVKKREKKWKHEMKTRWLQTKEVYEKAKGAIDALFTDAQDHAIKFDTNISHIISAEHLVQSMPYVYNKWLSDVPGMNYDIYTELERRITQAYSLYERRNIIRNGDFNYDLNHWYATPHAKVQQIDSTAVLVLPNWSSNVSQNLCVEHNRGYILRVTAKKEDMGKGYVTISDCNGNQETLTFTSCDNYVSNEITNDQSEYHFSQEMNEQRSYNPNEAINEQLDYSLGQVRNEQRCYTRNAITNDQSEYHFSQEMNEQRSYNPNETINEQRNYVTRTIDFFPDTDQVRIDIGETEGTFKVESIELICMKSQ